ncbi:hypothetical protein ACFQAS_12380 [Halopenitus salinus]|jgi:hypothetical protein|uniref:Yip1 domain-containing protein n=1 Tax=Halopenitus salinus TaxID=1198295 RepID=A0ABD5UWX7_9EURY
MYTPVEFITELVGGVPRLANIFLENVVAGGDPLSIVSFLVGQLLIVGSVVAIAYLAVGALANEVGIQFPSLGE